jgi:hypothetical protein
MWNALSQHFKFPDVIWKETIMNGSLFIPRTYLRVHTVFMRARGWEYVMSQTWKSITPSCICYNGRYKPIYSHTEHIFMCLWVDLCFYFTLFYRACYPFNCQILTVHILLLPYRLKFFIRINKYVSGYVLV